MIRIGVRELRQSTSKYLARVKAGETIEVTERGRLVAVLAPPSQEQTALERLIAEGKVRPAEAPFVFPERGHPLPGHPTGSEAIQEQKEERLP